MIVEIKHTNGTLLYSTDVLNTDYHQIRTALEKAVREKVNLTGADLSGANLRSTNLGCASLYSANLKGADLHATYLARADLTGADLTGADLTGAVLAGANLRSTNLTGAIVFKDNSTSAVLTGESPVSMIGPIGSRNDTLVIYRTNCGIYVKTGCFFGKVGHFKNAVSATHSHNSKHYKEYMKAIAFMSE